MNTRIRNTLAALLLSSLAPLAGAVNILTEENYPFAYLESGRVRGSATLIVEEAAKRSGLSVNIALLDWPTTYRRAQTEVDTCLYSIARLGDRENLFKWVAPIVRNRWSVFAPATSAIQISSLADLRKFKLAAVRADAKGEYLKSKGVSPYREFDNDAEIARSLFFKPDAPGRMDLWVAGSYDAPRVAAAEKLPAVKELFNFHEQPLYLACSTRTSKEIVEKLMTAIESMKKDGTLDRLAGAQK